MDFIKVTEKDSEYQKYIYKLLKASGKDMFEREGLHHWKKPYALNRIIEDVKNKDVYILLHNKQCVATFSLSSAKTCFFDDNKNFIYLSKFAVSPDLVRQGIGKKCIDFINSIVIKEGYEGIRLDVYKESNTAIQFYMKNGFDVKFEKNTTNFIVLCMENLQ